MVEVNIWLLVLAGSQCVFHAEAGRGFEPAGNYRPFAGISIIHEVP